MLVVLTASSKGLASVPIPSVGAPFVDAAGSLTMFVDESGSLGIEDAIANRDRFKASPTRTPNLGVTTHALWVRLVLEGSAAPFIAEVPYPQFDEVTLVVAHPDGTFRAMRTGDGRPFAERDQPEPNFVFEVSEPATELYLRVASSGNVAAPLRLWEPRAYQHHAVGDRLAVGVYLGIIAAMAAYNLFLLFLLSDKVYAYYVVFLVAFATFELGMNGLGYQYFWSESPWAQAKATGLGMSALSWSLCRLCSTALDVPRHLPRVAKAIRAIDLSLLVIVCTAFFVPSRLTIAGTVFIGPLGGLAVIVAMVLRLRQGSEPARYMLAGNLALIGGLVVFALKTAGALPANAFTVHAKEVGVVSQVVLLSLALAARIRSLQLDVALNQRLALDASRRTNEELARLDKLKDDFLANTSHELRTPLNGVLGLAETLVTGALDAGTRRTADLLLTSGRRLSAIVDDVLAFATLRKEGATLAREPVDVAALLEGVRTAFQAQATEKKLVLVLEAKLDGRGCLGEAAKVEQVLHHLVGNAVKFTESGTITLRADHANGRVQVSVQDTGPGIEAAALGSLFSALEQADGSAKRETGGLGLGLPLAKRIVDLLGGELAVATAPGEGSTFSFSVEACVLPAPEAYESVQIPSRTNAFAPVSRSLAPPPSMGSTRIEMPAIPALTYSSGSRAPQAIAGFAGRVLAVDDEPINLAVLARQLGNEGFEVVKASSGAEALERVKEGGFDIVLLDVMMPRMSGYEVCRIIRDELGNHELPIVLVTAKTQEQDLVDGFERGANDYIRKPFTKGELIARVHSHVREARTRRAIGRFVPREFLRLLGRKQVSDVQLGDQVERDISVLFSDIRDFTKLCESLSPDDTFRFINRCLERLGPEVRAHGGFIDKYIGDAIMALFPSSGADALRAAIAMQRAVDAFNADEPLAVPLAIGIGIHRGRTMLGTIGEEERMEATVVSDTVNVASRLEGLTKTYGARVIVSGSVAEEANEIGLTLRPLGHVALKGRGIPVEVFEVLDADADGIRWAKVASLDAFAEGVSCHEAGAHDAARACFLRVLERCPEDRAAQQFINESPRDDAPLHSLVKPA